MRNWAVAILGSLMGMSIAGGADNDNQLRRLPLNPQDEVIQTTANVSAFLMCGCLFVEKSAETVCRADQKADLMSEDHGLEITADFTSSVVKVSNGRWTAIARFLGPSRGCRLD